MKKIINFIITIAVFLNCAIIPVHAADNVTVKLNGKKIYFDQQPIIQNGRTLVPMRKIFEQLGCLVFWDENDRSVEAWRGGGYMMTLWIDDYKMELSNSNYITLDVPPTIIGDRTLVPLRAITESMGAQVEWDGNTRTVDIYYSYSPYPTERPQNGQTECKHTNTIDATIAGIGNYENTGSSTTHKVIDYVEVVCEDCGDTIDTKEKEIEKAHIFEDGLCTACGYIDEDFSDGECSHSKTSDVCMIDSREYENTGSAVTHKVIDEFGIYCDECNEQIDTEYREDEKSHNFENGVCKNCGYANVSSSTSNGNVSDYINGAFMYITVPAGKCIEIPNESNATLKIQMEGTGNAMECRDDGKFSIKAYSAREKKDSISIAKNSKAIIQNSGDNDLTVSIPAEYASYQVTNDKVYETISVSAGDKLEITGTKNEDIFYSNRDYEYIEYDQTKGILNRCSMTGAKGVTYTNSTVIYDKRTMIIKANNDIEFYYCPFVTSCVKTNKDPFNEITLRSGETVRIYSTEDSKTVVYTDGEHSFDAVIYGMDGKVKSQYQNKHNDYINVGKNCYIDFTNISDETVTLKIPSVYASVE